MHNFSKALQNKAQSTPNKKALLYLNDGKKETSQFTYKQLDEKARAIASELQKHNILGQRVLLLYPTGIEFTAGLLGCWYSGVIAVPMPCPPANEFEQHKITINTLAEDAEIAAILTLNECCAGIEKVIKKKVLLIATDKISTSQSTAYQPLNVDDDAIAYLQYTSGSTSSPKAVMISHKNLIHSLNETIQSWHYTKNSITLHWAPHTHVYGLVCGLLVPLYHGTLAIVIPPSAFIKTPLCWLSAISKYRVTHSGCPNFGYDLCLQHIKKSELSKLDLKSWKVAVNGGDIVRHHTLTEFVNKFQSCGFNLSHFCSAYGMSEVSGLIASTPFKRQPKALSKAMDTKALKNALPERVSSGEFIAGLDAIVVCPEKKEVVAPGETGEIWLAGPSVAQGYWRRPKETENVFNAQLANSKQPYFRTGDLGLILDKELYLTGRLKEVMIVRGKKYYPLDFETTIAQAIQSFKIDLPQIVFSSTVGNNEKIFVAQEINESFCKENSTTIIDVISQAIIKKHGVELSHVLFCPKNTLPKTASGKLQRKKAQLLYEANQLSVITLKPEKISATQESTAQGLLPKFIEQVADALNIKPENIDINAPLSRYAFDSINILQLTSRLNETFHLSLSPASLYEYKNLAEFYEYLLNHQNEKSLPAYSTQEKDTSNDIAIIGMSGQFPMASDIDAFWENLSQGKDCISTVPSSRWNWEDLTLQWGGFIDGVEAFDANFFNISPKEAELIDPQQRLFLQTVWKTIEDAGYAPDTIASLKTGLYVGVFNHDYAEHLQKNNIMDAYITTGTMNSMIANRISYYLNLTGPSETIDTACSSSLVAVHQAVNGILHGDCELAVAGGVNALLSPTSYISAQRAGMLSPEGRCKTFDKDANGYVRGEGVGALLLKRCSRALKDGDNIYGVIKGSAINHGGHVNTLTAPNPNAQAEVIVSACQRANISLDTLEYIEAHGTGTPLGDPIEINGLKKAFQQLASEQQLSSLPKHYCGIGTVKTHIGHLESAAGIAGIIKVLLAMKHEMIPANLHFNQLNPYIELEDSPFYIVDSAKKWAKRFDSSPRRAGISSFGFGGANAHVVLEESPKPLPTATTDENNTYLITLSAKTEKALQQRIQDLYQWLKSQTNIPCLDSISYTLNTGREHFAKRFCIITHSIEDLCKQLHAALSGKSLETPIEPFPELLTTRASHLNLNEFKKHYLEGKTLDWSSLYKMQPLKTSLPTYPFAKESYWVAAETPGFIAEEQPSAVSSQPAPQMSYYQPIWLEKSLPKAEESLQGSMLVIGEHPNNNQAILHPFQDTRLSCHAITFNEALNLDTAALPDYLLIALDSIQPEVKIEKKILFNLEKTFYFVHKVIQKIISLKPQKPIQILCISQNASTFSTALVGLAKTLHQEQRNIFCRLIELENNPLPIEELTQNDIHVRFSAKQKRSVLTYQQYSSERANQSGITLKPFGVYLITGGMGGLGLIFAKYLAKHYQANLILTGRSTYSSHHQATIKELELNGAKAIYIPSDVTSKKSVHNLINEAKKQFGHLNGIIHAAGLTKDNLISKANLKDMADVLAPKILGTHCLHEATIKEPLDFFLLCSSVSSIFGNMGQGDYAYANAFMDEFARLRNQQCASGLCVGQTISVNWPLWQEGGIHIPLPYQKQLEQSMGIVSLPTTEGLHAFKSSLQKAHSNWIVLPGEPTKLSETLQKTLFLRTPYDTHDQPTDDTQVNKAATQSFLKKLIAQTLKLSPNSIDESQAFDQYGIDSLMVIELNQRLEKEFSNLPKTLLFEHKNLSDLADYFIQNHSERLSSLLPESSPKASSNDKSTHLPSYHHLPSIKQQTTRQPSPLDAIAVIGMQGAFPQSKDLDSFWKHLVERHDLISEVPEKRWNWQDYYGTGPQQTECKWGGYIEDFDQFDAGFFNLSAREANLMDPQQRLFLETAWKTIEDAGYNPFELSSSKVGVFAGVGFSEYQPLTTQKDIYHGLVATGNSHSLIANRVSYFFNFNGPSESIDTACSSSLVAINRAVQAIQFGECDLAIAGGVSLTLNPETVVITNQLGALSPDGRCKTFDKDANGFVKGEGVGAILLKPLSKAQEDGDHIFAVIRSSSVNHGGKAISLTAPNVKAQSELLINAYSKANINPESISYIETHGTGTPLGDPVEIDGLKQAFNTLLPSKYQEHQIGIGSVKTNIGHLEPAAGIAGVIKLILSMKHETLPGLVHFNELNPYIQLEKTPFRIIEKTQKWHRIESQTGQIPLRAGVSSFGFGGTNAHVVLEEGRPHQALTSHKMIKPYYLFSLSAKEEKSLQQKIIDLLQWLNNNNKTVSLPSLSFTLNAGKAHFKYRCAIVADSIEGLLESLNELTDEKIPEYCILNDGQSCHMHSPVFDEVYQMALSALKAPDNIQQYREKLFIIADLYSKHYLIDWQELYIGEDVYRIAALPTYPFIKKRHWYDQDYSETSKSVPSENQAKPLEQTDLTGKILAYLQTLFAKKLQIPAQQIKLDETYEAYGVDSVIGLEITKQLIQDLGDMPKTILYERNQLRHLGQYIIDTHKEQASTLLENQAIPSMAGETPPMVQNPSANTAPRSSSKPKDIAIIGMNLRCPKANTLDEFWQNLITGEDCISTVPKDRWNYKDYPVRSGNEEKIFPHGGFITDVDKFDPLFFNISPSDAALIDPQERLFLQSVWSTLEDAGYTREKLRKKAAQSVGVFAGMTYNSYPLFISEEWQKGNQLPLNIQSFSIANRVSYFLDIHGPSFVIDTACSSSLAAIHLACESLIQDNCQMALAGGVNLSLHPSKYHFLGHFNFLSEQGRCTSFAEGGSGYVPSEGVGTVLLKPLEKAIEDNDIIYGVIKGSHMNHGGKTSGYTVPNPNAQSEVIKKAIQKANVDARTISYVEAHGTGTALGDPIEVRGLQEAYETHTNDKQFCAIGSVKSNIGHLEAAAGMPQLAKVLLQMRHKKLVPTIHTKRLNTLIDFGGTPFYVQKNLADWPVDPSIPYRAGISSFGAGGVNVHMVIEAYNAPEKSKASTERPYLLVLSAKNEERLTEFVLLLREYFKAHIDLMDEKWLADACYTLQVGRESMNTRVALLFNTKEELMDALEHYPNSEHPALWVNPNTENHPRDRKGSNLWHLALQWINGVNVEWTKCYDHQPDMISLPTYPFAKRRCWIPTQDTPQTAPHSPQTTSKKEESTPLLDSSKDWLYITGWDKKSQLEHIPLKENDGKWLIMSDFELGFVLQNHLGPHACLYAFCGEQYEKINNECYYINPNQKKDYEKLLRQIHKDHGDTLKGILYLYNALSDKEPNNTDPSCSLRYTFQSLLEHQWEHSLKFSLITETAQQVVPSEKINTWQHHLWSMTRIFAAENGQYQVLLLDLDTHQSLHKKAKTITNEFSQLTPEQNHIAYRDGERYTIRLKPYALLSAEISSWKPPQAAMITGGLGALGYEVAQYLAAQGTKYLLLTGTSLLSEKSCEKNAMLKTLEQQGVNVKYAAVDVTKKSKMRPVIEQAEKDWQQSIDGIFHLAGITTDNIPIAKISESLWQNVLDVKIKGALVLHELFEQSDLSSFVLFSSISAVPHFGIAGLSAYAAANEFMNGLALYRRSQNLPAMSINWIAWSEKGMSHRYSHDDVLQAFGMETLSPKHGISILDTLLKANPAEITVCKIDWQRFFKVNATLKKHDFFAQIKQKTRNIADEVSATIADEKEVEQLILEQFIHLLSLEKNEICQDTPFQNYGIDSIVGINFTQALSEYFPEMVSPMDLYRYPTLRQLIQFVTEQVKAEGALNKAPNKKEEYDLFELNQLNVDELNQLLESELKELEFEYDRY